MLEALSAALHLLVRAFGKATESMGTTVLAIVAGLLVVIIQLITAYCRGGWDTVNAEWKGDTGRGVIVIVGVWLCAFIWSIGAMVFSDHKQARERVSSAEAEIRILKNTISNRDVEIKTIRDQVSGQQDTINKTLLELGRSQQREVQPTRIIRYFIGTLPVNARPEKTSNQGTFLLLTNRAITPIRLLVTCERDFVEAYGQVLGTGAVLAGGWGGRVTRSSKQYGIGIVSPAWTPTNPMMVTIYANQQDLGLCTFEQQ
jgi:hypothetical protein